MLGTKSEGQYKSDWLVYEEDDIGRYSRENVTIGANQTITTGQPLEWGDAGKTFAIAHDGAAANGFAGIALDTVTTGAGQTAKSVMIARLARVAYEGLTFITGATDANKKAIVADMKAAGIVLTDPQNVPA